jgi:hypothetical protein
MLPTTRMRFFATALALTKATVTRATVIAILILPRGLPAQSMRISAGARDFRLAGTALEDAKIDDVTDAQFLADGTIAVIDQTNERVVHLSAAGLLLGASGRKGSGPGEYQFPIFVRQLHATIAVFDNGPQRFTYLLPRQGTLALIATRNVPFVPVDLCISNGRPLVYAYDRSDKTLFRWMDDSGRVSEGFGKPWYTGADGAPAALDLLNETGEFASLACQADGTRFAVASALRGEIRSYRSDGALLWQTALTGFLPTMFRAIARGTVIGFQPGQQARDIVIGLHQLSPSLLLLQIGRLTREHPSGAGHDFSRIDSRLIRMSDGVEVGRQTDLPFVIAMAGNRMLTTGVDQDLWLSSSRFVVRQVAGMRH